VLESPLPVYTYKPGSWGPSEADALAGPDGWLLSQRAAE
jgi:hypothetical protein